MAATSKKFISQNQNNLYTNLSDNKSKNYLIDMLDIQIDRN
jgi:hypothetical protein